MMPFCKLYNAFIINISQDTMMNDTEPSQRVELFLSCRNIKDADVFSKSDPYIRVSFKRDFTQKQFSILGRTETIQNSLNPNFSKSFPIEYIFQSRQDIRFELFDDDGNPNSDDYIGIVETTLSNLMGAKGQTSILEFKNSSAKEGQTGKLIVRCEKIQESSQFFNMKLRAEKLLNVDSFFDFWDKSDPYIKFLKIRGDNTFVEVARTEIIKDNLDPSWNPIQIQVSRLINPQKMAFKIEVWDWEQDGNDQFIGEASIASNQLANGLMVQISNPKKKAGAIIIQKFSVFKRPSFVDYLRGGLQLNMAIAIDFTGSNGIPKAPTSLHYMNPNAPNQYQLATTCISQILLSYDSDKRIQAFGFGAKPRFNGGLNSNLVDHCFPLSGRPDKLEALGFADLMEMYKAALMQVQLSGPTYFGPIIEAAMACAQGCKARGSNVYQILLILTDGQIHDMDKTTDLLVQAAILPLSIIIVGVGNADFGNMDRLDGDGGLYGSNGARASRDIVQFVPFRNMQLDGNLLAKELLAELPNQIVQYMKLINKPPGQFIQPNIPQNVPAK